jgi:hypothetical protein
VIFIDDLDRCLPERVVEVFESIKLFLDCERCVFVLGFDRDQVKKAFESKFPDKGEDLGSRYVEKFVQLEFELPPKTRTQVEEFVKAVAPEELKNNEKVLEIISKFIQPNPRKILRWINRVLLIQELFSVADREHTAPQPLYRPETVPVWLFIKSFFPEFARLVEKDQSVLNLAVKRARAEASPEETERLKEVTTDKLLDDFLRSLDQSVITDPRLPEVIFQTTFTITESVSVLQPDSMVEKIDGIQSEEVASFAGELIANSMAKALETAKLIGTRLTRMQNIDEYNANQNRIRFLKYLISNAASLTEKRTLYEIIINILKSLSGQYLWVYTNELKSLLSEPSIHNYALEKGHIDLFVSNLTDAGSWDYAGQFSEVVLLFVTELTQDQTNKIALASLSNMQIYDSFRARPDVTQILKANKDSISSDTWNRLSKERPKSFKLTE